MPLVKRLVEPVYIARSTLDKQVRNELEGVTVNSLAGVIKQLSSISKHAEDLFGDLVNEAASIFQRSTLLSQRVQNLYERTSQLDSAAKEDVKVEDFSLMNHYKSRRQEEQQVLTPNTLPQALKEVYISCDEPPALAKFTPYRDDGKDGLKFYTDRNYFYDLWVQQQTQIIKDRKRKEKKKRQHRGNKKKKVHDVQKKKFASVDAEFVGDMSKVAEAPAVSLSERTPPPPTSAAQDNRPVAGPPPPPAPPDPQPSPAVLSAPTAPPPPPPPVVSTGVPPPPPPPMSNSPALPHMSTAQPYVAPPPPPPPAPLVMGGPPPPPPPPVSVGPAAPPPPPVPNIAGPPPPPAPPVVAPAAPKVIEPDPRKDLLSAIRMGKKLRSVEHKDEVKKQEYGTDVASILKRRIVMEVSDSSDESGSDSDDSGWSD